MHMATFDGAVSNLGGQYNFTSVSVVVLLFERHFGNVPGWALASLDSAVGLGDTWVASLRNHPGTPSLLVAAAFTFHLARYFTTQQCTMPTSARFLPPLPSQVFAGAVMGMISLGFLGDAVGRQNAMVATCFVMATGAALSCLAWGSSTSIYTTIAAWRFVMGVGIGGVRGGEIGAKMRRSPGQGPKHVDKANAKKHTDCCLS